MKILNLILYSDNKDYYKKMYNILTNYYNHYSYVKTYFYKYNENINNDVELIDNIINIKGKENYNPGILEKTLKTLKYVEKEFEDYDYLIRTNISSVVDFDLLKEQLEATPILYSGGTHILILKWIDEPAGIIDTRHFFTPYVSGTSIIFSKEGYKLLINNTHLIDKTLIDDVAIGVFFKTINIQLTNLSYNNNRHIDVPENLKYYDINNILNDNFIVYRNRHDTDRNEDANNMKIITDAILNKNK